MKRQEIIDTFGWEPEHGGLMAPGKFEGCHIYAPHFHDLWLDGGGDHIGAGEDDGSTIIHVADADRAEFPELSGVHSVAVCEDNNGFFYCRPLTLAEHNELAEDTKEGN